MYKYENQTFRSIVKESAGKYSDKHALSFVGEEGYTYGSVYRKIGAFISFLENLGIRNKDKVALVGPNSPEWVISYLAITYMGATVVPILNDFSRIFYQLINLKQLKGYTDELDILNQTTTKKGKNRKNLYKIK